MPFLKSLPDHANAMHVWPLHERGFEAWGPLIKAVMRREQDSEFAHGDKELIGAYASAMNGCTHCYSAHSATAVVLGVGSELFEDVEIDPWKAPVDERWKPMLAFIRKLCREPAQLTQSDADRVFDAGWSERALTDAIQIAGAFSFMNVMMIGHGADQQDLRAIGPLQAILRDNDDYGYATEHRDMKKLYAKAIERFGADAAEESFKSALGVMAGGNAEINKKNSSVLLPYLLKLLKWYTVFKLSVRRAVGIS
ncbi:MAG: hypothetical protein AAGI11_14700 [Pseudomonadota bacterium]